MGIEGHQLDIARVVRPLAAFLLFVSVFVLMLTTQVQFHQARFYLRVFPVVVCVACF